MTQWPNGGIRGEGREVSGTASAGVYAPLVRVLPPLNAACAIAKRLGGVK